MERGLLIYPYVVNYEVIVFRLVVFGRVAAPSVFLFYFKGQQHIFLDLRDNVVIDSFAFLIDYNK